MHNVKNMFGYQRLDKQCGLGTNHMVDFALSTAILFMSMGSRDVRVDVMLLKMLNESSKPLSQTVET